MQIFIYDKDTDSTVSVTIDETIEKTKEIEFFFDEKVRKAWHRQE